MDEGSCIEQTKSELRTETSGLFWSRVAAENERWKERGGENRTLIAEDPGA